MTSPEGPDPTPPPDPVPHDPYRYQQPTQQPPGYWPYQPPAPARTSPWVWVAIGTTAFITLLVALFALSFFFVGPFSGFSDYSSDGETYYVDQRSVDRAMEPACGAVQDAADALPLFGSVADGQAGLGRLADAARGVSTAIDGADPNDSAQQLSADWRSVGTALDDFSTRLATDPSARLDMPAVSGDLVSDRILWGNDVCYVPAIVIGLDPDAAAGDTYAY